MSDTYVVAAVGEWNRRVFDEAFAARAERWVLVSAKEQLTLAHLQELRPRYVFLLHWSWKVPPEIFSSFECVGFHMTDLPYGRGGTPLQNLIVRGHRHTMLTAFKVSEEMDAGPIYLKAPLPLDGRAQQIYERASKLAVTLIDRILTERPAPVPQTGEAVVFERRTPAESRLPEHGSVEQLYDHIRMLDADGYPRAFIESGRTRIEFSSASLEDDVLHAQAHIRSIADRRSR